MQRPLLALALFLASALAASAQTLDDLNLQLHGYATQGFLYSAHNNWNTTASSDGSAAWTEAVVNLGVQPSSRLRVGIQARYYLLGGFGNSIALDWAQVDYKVNEHFGIRAGKVKSPAGLLNDVQDIDPAELWVLLPPSIYSIASRNSVLAHYGGVAYGSQKLGERLGRLRYFGYGGQRLVSGEDGLFQPLRDKGISLPNGATGPMYGAVLHWETPIHGLMAGVSLDSEHTSGAAVLGSFTGTLQASHFYQPYFYGSYERNRLTLAAEYTRQALTKITAFTGGPRIVVPKDQRAFYAMATYKLTSKLSGGAYYSSSFDRRLAVSSARFQKDWALSARYDCNANFYLKLEQHIMDGTELGYSSSDNTNLKPNDRMTLFKLGAIF